MNVLQAHALAARLHANQVDKAGNPYINHPVGVFLRVVQAGGDIFQQIAALLHDTKEDCGATDQYLLSQGVPPESVEIVSDLTKPPGMPYQDHINHLLTKPRSAFVKACDLQENSDPQRLALLPADIAQRLRSKYEPAIAAIRGNTSPAPAYIHIGGRLRPTTNNMGTPIAPTENLARVFWEKFGESCVVDTQGHPIVTYHGSPTAFGEFDTALVNEIDTKRLGAYFTTNPKLAKCYGEHVRQAYLAIPTYLDVSTLSTEETINSLPVDAVLKRELRSAFKSALKGQSTNNQYAILESAIRGNVRQNLEQAGTVGIKYTEGYGDAYIAFHRDQIIDIDSHTISDTPHDTNAENEQPRQRQ